MVPVSIELTDAERHQIAALVSEGQKIDAIRLLRSLKGTGLRESKDVIDHITRTSGTCHRCDRPVATGAVSTCGNCGSVNLDW